MPSDRAIPRPPEREVRSNRPGRADADGERHRFHIRDGKVVEVIVYFERTHALADLGLKDG